MNWYVQGEISFREGMGPFCPIVPDGTVDTIAMRQAWFDGYYNAMMSEKYDWWEADKWSLRNRMSERECDGPPADFYKGRRNQYE